MQVNIIAVCVKQIPPISLNNQKSPTVSCQNEGTSEPQNYSLPNLLTLSPNSTLYMQTEKVRHPDRANE